MQVTQKGIRWVVQSNLTSVDDLNGLRTACIDNKVAFSEITIIPFSTSLPAFEFSPCNIYYGSTTFNSLVYNNNDIRRGLFFDPVTFSMENYIAKWGKHMLNYDASITTFSELLQQPYASDRLLFIRPDDDSKSFSGEVKQFAAIREWYEKLKSISNINLTAESKIIVSQPYSLKYEWRLWIVDKKVVASSLYRTDFRLTKEKGAPPSVIAFAEERCKEYTPHDIFVMDICLCGEAYFIVECGCMNGAGFYKADIDAIVRAVTSHVDKICSESDRKERR